MTTKLQREDMDWEMDHEKRAMEKWEPYNRWTKSAVWERRIHAAKPWVCAAIAVPIAIIIGAEILFHLIAFIGRG
jgi:hypothetical protein